MHLETCFDVLNKVSFYKIIIYKHIFAKSCFQNIRYKAPAVLFISICLYPCMSWCLFVCVQNSERQNS